MRYLTFTLLVFSLIVSVTVCASYVAHAGADTSSELSVTVDIDNSNDNSLGDNSCEMACGGCCIHHAMDTTNDIKEVVSLKATAVSIYQSVFVSQSIHGLKRPPKS